MKKNYKKNITKQAPQQVLASKTKIRRKKPVLTFYIKLIVLILIILGILVYSDKKGYFNTTLKNDHTTKKWNAFYDFIKRNQVDILMFGNSHLYCGINPKNLSITLGSNAFILAAPGTCIADCYWGLKETLKVTSPKIVVIETYVIKDFNPYDFQNSALSNQIKSFYARKDLTTKLISTPFLFATDNYHLAWSNTLRNHNYLFDNFDQIQENVKLIRKKTKSKKNKELYLGRYVRFTTGIKDSIMDLYHEQGAPVDGSMYSYNRYTEKYVDRIRKLCKENNIILIFLTLPMFNQHVKNYEAWENKLKKLLGDPSDHWLDLQAKDNYDYLGFNKSSFESTYAGNQHMTYLGSLLATYKLASYIRDTLQVKLPNRASESRWHRQFYGEEGYFIHYSPLENDRANKVICQNKTFRNVKIDEIIIKYGNTTNCIAKISMDKLKNLDYKNKRIRLLISYKEKGKEKEKTVIDLKYDGYHTPKSYVIFSGIFKPIEIIDVLDGVII
jgi:hypothetical protein